MRIKPREYFVKNVFSVSSKDEFENLSLELFRYQAHLNVVYRRFIELLGVDPICVTRVEDIPCLPVSLFKSNIISCLEKPAETLFKSSGTGSSIPSTHYINDISLYRKSFLKCFRLFYGEPSDYRILALLPSYLERGNSSLVYMADVLIKEGENPESGFYLKDTDKLLKTISYLESKKSRTILLGVSFALVELAIQCKLKLNNTIIIETGGMKGRRREMIREELHLVLKNAFGVKSIHSEYSMTELLSQAWSTHGGNFKCPPWMKVLIRDAYDPLTYIGRCRTGGINIIDLANIDSCAFIETSDLGRLQPDDRFEVLGRYDNSEIRGCNLLIDEQVL